MWQWQQRMKTIFQLFLNRYTIYIHFWCHSLVNNKIRQWLKINWSEWNCGLISAIFQVLSRAKQCPWVLVCRNRVCWAAEQASFSSSPTKIALLVKHWHWLQKVWTFSSLMSDTCQLWRASRQNISKSVEWSFEYAKICIYHTATSLYLRLLFTVSTWRLWLQSSNRPKITTRYYCE